MTFLGGQACGFRGHCLNSRHRLTADPDFARILAKVHRAIHRLHRRVRQKWNLIDRLDLGGGACHGLVCVADVLGHRARTKRCLVEFAGDLFRGEFCVRTVVPFDLSAAKPFFAAPIWSATTATASSSRTIWRTPLMAFAAVSSRLMTR